MAVVTVCTALNTAVAVLQRLTNSFLCDWKSLYINGNEGYLLKGKNQNYMNGLRLVELKSCP